MSRVTIHQAKTNLSKLIAEVLAGGEVVIAKGSEPVAKLVALKVTRPPRRPGSMKGKIDIGPAFFEALPDAVIKAWNDPE
jgi:prevent-host-death family protein